MPVPTPRWMKPPAIAAAPPQLPDALEHENLAAGPGRLDRRGGTGESVARDDDIGLVVQP